MIKPVPIDDTLYVGDTWRRTYTVTDLAGVPLNLTGYDARLQCRYRSGARVPIFDLTVGDGITIAAADGELEAVVEPDVASALPPGHHRYDMQITLPDGFVHTPFAGDLIISRDVTRLQGI